jgi:hypothetical protein
VADILMTLVPTMGDTTSSAIVSALAISAAAIPLADSMQEDSTVVDSMAVADTDRPEEATNADLLSAPTVLACSMEASLAGSNLTN